MEKPPPGSCTPFTRISSAHGAAAGAAPTNRRLSVGRSPIAVPTSGYPRRSFESIATIWAPTAWPVAAAIRIVTGSEASTNHTVGVVEGTAKPATISGALNVGAGAPVVSPGEVWGI